MQTKYIVVIHVTMLYLSAESETPDDIRRSTTCVRIPVCLILHCICVYQLYV